MNQKRMTATTPYSNGSIGWPEGMSANWPAGEERVLPDNVWEQIMRDGTWKGEVHFYHEPEPPAPAVEQDQPTTEPAAPPAPPKHKGGRPKKAAPAALKE